jgi:hypothetical protein
MVPTTDTPTTDVPTTDTPTTDTPTTDTPTTDTPTTDVPTTDTPTPSCADCYDNANNTTDTCHSFRDTCLRLQTGKQCYQGSGGPIDGGWSLETCLEECISEHMSCCAYIDSGWCTMSNFNSSFCGVEDADDTNSVAICLS